MSSGRRQLDPGHDQQVIGYDAAPDIAPESRPTRPVAAVKAKGAFQGGNSRFDTSPEVAQHPVNPGALGHLHNGEPSLFRKHGIPDLAIFRMGQVVPGSKTAIGRNLPGHTAKGIGMPIRHPPTQIAVGGIAALDHAIKDHRGGAIGKKHLESVE